MKIITISREFGSGGRELGKRLADILTFDYYDKEIIGAVAANKGLDQDYTASILERPTWKTVPLHFRRSFSGVNAIQSKQMVQTSLLLEQKRVIEAIAQAGRDCVIVGRNADVLLKKYHPFCIFVCAGMDAKIQRCIKRAESNENLTHQEIRRKIRDIDKGRRQTRDIIAGGRWGECGSYHLTVNTTEWEIKTLALAVADFAERWFERREQ
jgi:cytidylate kinase